jgi:hypothetical protein
VILYVTCTFAPEENEAVVSDLLAGAPVELEPLELDVPYAPGLTSFQGTTYDPRLAGAVRVYPHHLDSGGLFMARLRRLDGDVLGFDPAEAWSPLPCGFPGDGRPDEEAGALAEDAVAKVLARHAVAPEALERFRWTLRRDTLWLHACGEWPLPSWPVGSWRAVAVGLRAIELDSRGRPRATNDLLRFASSAVASAAVDVDRAALSRLLAGESLLDHAATPLGPVALRLEGEVVGRAACTPKGLRSEIPKARAAELARVLALDERR